MCVCLTMSRETHSLIWTLNDRQYYVHIISEYPEDCWKKVVKENISSNFFLFKIWSYAFSANILLMPTNKKTKCTGNENFRIKLFSFSEFKIITKPRNQKTKDNITALVWILLGLCLLLNEKYFLMICTFVIHYVQYS